VRAAAEPGAGRGGAGGEVEGIEMGIASRLTSWIFCSSSKARSCSSGVVVSAVMVGAEGGDERARTLGKRGTGMEARW